MPRPSSREKILDAAVKTLYERGFNGCGVQDITDAAGVPKGSFYNHFESKEVMGAEALDRFWQRNGCGLLGILSDESVKPLERLERYFTVASSSLSDGGYRCGCLVGNLSAELADQSRLVRDRLASVFAGWTRPIELCLKEAQQAGEVRTDLDAKMLADFLVNAWQGAVLRSRVDKDGDAFAAFHSIIFTTIRI
jgi:TetR/AcrR family transcriptional repressor of nem operon